MECSRQVRKSWLVAIALIVAGCGVSRFESIDTCEFERWQVMGITLWLGQDCKGNKDDNSMLRKTTDELRNMKEPGDEN